jgi:hypothetical protein
VSSRSIKGAVPVQPPARPLVSRPLTVGQWSLAQARAEKDTCLVCPDSRARREALINLLALGTMSLLLVLAIVIAYLGIVQPWR